MCKKSLIRNNRGYTLIEAIISASLLAILLIGTLAAMSSSIFSNQFSSNETLCQQWAEDGLEMMMRVPFDNLPSISSPFVNDYDSIPKYEKFRRVITLNNIDDDNYQVTVSVTWKHQSGNASKPVVVSMIRTR
jgi:Tfp pilus assembly protein PilV